MKISLPVRNFLAATSIGVASAALCWVFLHHFRLGGADFNWPYQAARRLLAGEAPYSHTPQGTIPYPLPAALPAIPLLVFPPEVAGAVFFGISSGLLALGLIRQDPARLLIFLAYPYWSALMTAQWTPLLMCAAFFPLALAFSVMKPQIGAPVALAHLSRRGAVAAVVVLVASLALLPRWPIEWVRQLSGYQHFVPLLVLPGPLLALALWRHRDRDSWLLFLSAVMPQRWFYDSFLLWLIPKSRRSILATVACSWVIGVWRWSHTPHTMQQVGRWSVLAFYLPMLVVILTRTGRDEHSALSTQHSVNATEC